MNYENIAPEQELAYLQNAADAVAAAEADHHTYEVREADARALGMNQYGFDMIMAKLVDDAESWANLPSTVGDVGDEIEQALSQQSAPKSIGDDYLDLLEQSREAECIAQQEKEDELEFDEEDRLSPLAKAALTDYMDLDNVKPYVQAPRSEDKAEE